ncbi:MAG: exodeoxyribonuclease VII large subunit [Burkholderiales bacterium]|nr:exodeoxyribonuclease VII large subunit [Burkholderiales bacterium]
MNATHIMSSNTLSISELNQRIATLLERNVPLLWVQGEISNLKQYPSGHWYFSLKDENAQVRAVMFRQKAALLKWQPREGDAVQAYVGVGLYAARGDFQLTVESMRPAGLGTLYERFIKLKEDLAEQGLFDAKHKKTLPNFARAIGIITSPQAAALRDVAHTVARRAPHIQLYIYPTLVQGELAARQIADAIALANQNPDLDTLLIIRGGGSLEDLWAFNEPEVAHAIFNSRLPTISGVGHETDTTIADFVADVRAATPTAAAELISSPTHADWHDTLSNQARSLHRAITDKITQVEQHLDRLTAQLLTPAQRLNQQAMHLQHLALRLQNSMSTQVQNNQRRYEYLAQTSQRLRPALPLYTQALSHKQVQLHQTYSRLLNTHTQSLENRVQLLNQLNPENVLNRGFAYVQTQNGDIVYNANALRAGDVMTIQLARGRVIGTVNHTETE